MRSAAILTIAALLILVLLAPVPATHLCAFQWRGWPICRVIEIVHTWQALVSGLLALLAAGATVLFLRKQIMQVEAHREDDLRQTHRAIADTILIDVLDTSDRLRNLAQTYELFPPLSETSRRLVFEATKVSPALAIALQKHCSEVGGFSSEFSAAASIAGSSNATYTAGVLAKRKPLAFRAHVLSYCFGVASTQIDRLGKAKGPFITASKLQEIEQLYQVNAADRHYLEHLLQTTGIG